MSKYTMNPEIKSQWVEALRSGEYAQAQTRLVTSDGYCCLGVLCDLAVKSGLDIKVTHVDTVTQFAGEESILPMAVVEWAGLAVDGDSIDMLYNQNPYLDVDFDGNHKNTLAYLNDHGMNFNGIANVIEEQL